MVELSRGVEIASSGASAILATAGSTASLDPFEMTKGERSLATAFI